MNEPKFRAITLDDLVNNKDKIVYRGGGKPTKIEHWPELFGVWTILSIDDNGGLQTHLTSGSILLTREDAAYDLVIPIENIVKYCNATLIAKDFHDSVASCEMLFHKGSTHVVKVTFDPDDKEPLSVEIVHKY